MTLARFTRLPEHSASVLWSCDQEGALIQMLCLHMYRCLVYVLLPVSYILQTLHTSKMVCPQVVMHSPQVVSIRSSCGLSCHAV